MPPTLRFHESLAPSPTLPALIWAEGITMPPADAGPSRFLQEIVERARAAGESFWPAGIKDRVRRMLRHGAYRPSGRAKPASEFLLNAALAGAMPSIPGPVDVNNAVSLASGLPASLFDTDRSGDRLLLRRGRSGESYVFNPSGQSIDLEDLLLVARDTGGDGEPCGNPVKDSMATKVQAGTRRVAGVLFAPADEPVASLETWSAEFERLLVVHCGARASGHLVLPRI